MNPFKPWYVYRPSQLVRRLRASLYPPKPGCRPLKTAWGGVVHADPSKTIGRSILTTGVYDLAVSETLARLTDPGDWAADAGANVGYMTLLLASCARGPGGRVFAFEPHPELFRRLLRTAAAPGLGVACVDLREVALGDAPGRARLVQPPEYPGNDGTARLSGGDHGEPVEVVTLDSAVGAHSLAVLKVDVEGSEAAVLRGAARLLAGRRVRHVVFEAHDGPGGEAATLLRDAGYALYALGWSLRGPRALPAASGSLARAWEAPSLVATTEPTDLVARMRPRGWRVLSRLTDRRASAVPPRTTPPPARTSRPGWRT